MKTNGWRWVNRAIENEFLHEQRECTWRGRRGKGQITKCNDYRFQCNILYNAVMSPQRPRQRSRILLQTEQPRARNVPPGSSRECLSLNSGDPLERSPWLNSQSIPVIKIGHVISFKLNRMFARQTSSPRETIVRWTVHRELCIERVSSRTRT